MALVAVNYLKAVVDILCEYEETGDSASKTVTQVLITGTATLLGAFLGW